MDYAHKLSRLQCLLGLVDQYLPVMHRSSEDTRRLNREICEVYGELSDVFEDVVGRQRIEVPHGRAPGSSTYPNLFEAGFLSGRSIYSHQGKTELLKVIGQIKRRAEASSGQDQNRIANRIRDTNRVFLVHGHDEAALQSCARFVEKLGLPVTILREQPNQGRTLIEKFEDLSDAAFAIVLLTPDDRGGKAGIPCEDQKPRARQNVILELGFFIGRLGRERVCALYGKDVEVPSDYHGVAFVQLDSEMAWRLELARELQAVGLQIDLNKAI